MRTKISIWAILIITACSENFEQIYPDYQSFKEGNFRQQLWFPNIVLSDAHNFKEIHNIDNNNVFGRFSYLNSKVYDSLFVSITESDSIGFTAFQQKAKKLKSRCDQTGSSILMPSLTPDSIT